MSQPVILVSGGLSIVLSRTADRFCHEVVLTTDEARVVLASLEGTDDQAWPASPPLQELHLQPSDKGANAMLVGRAGRSHWSASIELDRSQEAVSFDVACRASGPIERLGSGYRSLVGPPVATAADERRTFLLPELQMDVLEGEAHVSKEGETHVLSIVPVWTTSSASQTVRWRYRIRRTGSGAR